MNIGRMIGIYKELRESEDVLAETPDIVVVEGGSSFLGSDNITAKVYLTNQRILFLIIGTVDSKYAKTPFQELFEKSMKSSKISNLIGSLYGVGMKAKSKSLVTVWSEIPLNVIKKVNTPTFGPSVLEIQCETIKSGLRDIFRKNPTLKLHLANRDMWRVQLESVLKQIK